jgi:hypothetical protein
MFKLHIPNIVGLVMFARQLENDFKLPKLWGSANACGENGCRNDVCVGGLQHHWGECAWA